MFTVLETSQQIGHSLKSTFQQVAHQLNDVYKLTARHNDDSGFMTNLSFTGSAHSSDNFYESETAQNNSVSSKGKKYFWTNHAVCVAGCAISEA